MFPQTVPQQIPNLFSSTQKKEKAFGEDAAQLISTRGQQLSCACIHEQRVFCLITWPLSIPLIRNTLASCRQTPRVSHGITIRPWSSYKYKFYSLLCGSFLTRKIMKLEDQTLVYCRGVPLTDVFGVCSEH